MNNQSDFLNACRRRPVKRIPVWFMRQAGRYMPQYRAIRAKHSMLEICKTPKLAAEITLQPVEILGVDAAILFTDLLLPLEAMGAKLEYAKGEGPIIHNPVRRPKDLKNLRLIEAKKDLLYLLESVELARRLLPQDIPLIGFGGAPFTLASYMIEGGHSNNFAATKNLMYNHPQTWRELMEMLAAVMISCLRGQIENGVEALQIFDSWVGHLSAGDYETHVLPYTKKLIRTISNNGVPVIHFGTGCSHLYKLMQQAGGQVMGIDWRISLKQARAIIGPDMALQGNLDPAILLGPLSLIKKEVKRILNETGRKPGFIFNTGHGLLPQTPVKNVKAAVDWVHGFRC